jgi:LysR family transcriptional regulator, glycine cleavage system transcriptional activator
MKQAAHELALTPGAVSQRIRQFEEAAGRRLFSRTPSGVELSAAGEAMFVALAEPFRAIEAVDRELGGPSSSRVTISTTPSFAATWLVPRLSMFARRHPNIEIAVETGNRQVDLKRERSNWRYGTDWESIPAWKPPGSLPPNLSSSRTPIC